MKKRPIKVFGIGQCCLDYLGKIPVYPRPDEKCEFSDLTVQGGGVVATALVALARWGIPCAFSGVIGDDTFGPLIQDSLDSEGIDTSGITIRKGAESQFAFIAADPGTATRTIFWRRPTGKDLTPNELNYDLIGQAKLMHTDGIFPEATLAACETAKKSGTLIAVDAGSLREGMLEIARLSDYFIASHTFARTLIGEDDPTGACRKLAEFGPSLVCVTLGSQGYAALDRGRIIERPAYSVNAIDTTGCGDIFHAGCIYGLLKKWPIDKALDFAAWAAAQASLKLGGRTGIPSVESWSFSTDSER